MNPKIRAAVDYIEEHLGSPLQVVNIAAAAGLSEFHFSREFKKAHGMGPHGYLRARRVQRAKELLARTALPVRLIGPQVGYRTQAHFTCVFKQMEGMTPGAYRAHVLAQAQPSVEASQLEGDPPGTATAVTTPAAVHAGSE